MKHNLTLILLHKRKCIGSQTAQPALAPAIKYADLELSIPAPITVSTQLDNVTLQLVEPKRAGQLVPGTITQGA